jgi:hypothetical protein
MQQMHRYLHQSIGGLDCDYLGVLKKVAGIRLKLLPEIVSYSKTVCVYALAVMTRCTYGVTAIRADSKEVFTVAPDLVLASRDPHLNVSTYATPSQFNPDKAHRAASEATCVQGMWDQVDGYREAHEARPEATDGISQEDLLLFRRMRRKGKLANLGDLAGALRAGMFGPELSIRAVHALGGGAKYTKSLWFCFMIGLETRRDIGTYASVSTLAGKSLSRLFTTKGSIIASSFSGVDPVLSVRKATAAAHALSWRLLGKDRPDPMKALAEMTREERETMLDQWDLVQSIVWGKLQASYLVQISEKDAEGKDREISTLQILFALLAISCEDCATTLSESIPEDLVTGKNKDLAFSRMIMKSMEKKGKEDGKETAFLSGDMSAYGPNMMGEMLAVSSAALVPDMATYALFETTIAGSGQKQVRPPHNLVNQALRPLMTMVNGEASYVAQLGPEAPPCVERGRTSKVLRGIHQQFHYGNEHGPKGSVSFSVPQGMPGQGILTMTCSINHAGVVRYIARTFKRLYGWECSSVVTGDDSLMVVTFSSTDETFLGLHLRPARMFLLALTGLLDNGSKFNLVWMRPEINSFYHLGAEAIHPVWRYGSALVAVSTTANLQEDLLMASARAADVCKMGGSHSTGAVVAAANMVLAVDAHHMWPVYFNSIKKWSEDKDDEDCLLFSPPECFGLPAIDPATTALTPMGLRAASVVQSFPGGVEDGPYANWLSVRPFEVPTYAIGSVPTDTQALLGTRAFGVEELADNHGHVKGSLSLLPEVQLPYVNGLSGRTRRMAATLRLSRELGPGLVRMATLGEAPGDPLTAQGILLLSLHNLSGPLSRGERDLAPHVQYADLEHSYDHPHYKVGKDCLLPGVTGIISRRMVVEALLKPGACLAMRESFKTMINAPSPVPAWGEAIRDSLSQEIQYALSVSRHVAQSKPEANKQLLGGEEYRAALSAPRKFHKALVDIGPVEALPVDFKALEARLLEAVTSPEGMAEMPLSVRGRCSVQACSGAAGGIRATTLATALLSRIKGALPSRYQVLTYVGVHSRTKAEFTDDFLTRNFATGVQVRRGGERVAYRTRPAWVVGLGTPFLPARVAHLIAANLIASQKAAIAGKVASMVTPLVSTVYSPSGAEVYADGEGTSVVSNVQALMRDSVFAMASVAAQAMVRSSCSNWEALILASSRLGWVGSPGSKSRSDGLVASWSGRSGGVARVYSVVSRTGDGGGRLYSRLYLTTERLPTSVGVVVGVEGGDPGALQLLEKVISFGGQGGTYGGGWGGASGTRARATDLVDVMILDSSLQGVLTMISNKTCVVFQSRRLALAMPVKETLSLAPEEEGVSGVDLARLEPQWHPLLTSMRDLSTLGASLPSEVDHVLLASGAGAGVMALIGNSEPSEVAAMSAWSEVSLRSYGAKSPRMTAAAGRGPEVAPSWMPVPQDGWDDGDLPASEREMVFERSQALIGILEEEWTDNLRRSTMGSHLSPYDSSDYLNLSGTVLRGGYIPGNPALYVAAWVYLLTTVSASIDPNPGESGLDMGLVLTGRRSGASLSLAGPNSRLSLRSKEAVEKARRRHAGGLLPEMSLATLAERIQGAMTDPEELEEEDEDKEITEEEQAKADAVAKAAFLFLGMEYPDTGPTLVAEEEE